MFKENRAIKHRTNYKNLNTQGISQIRQEHLLAITSKLIVLTHGKESLEITSLRKEEFDNIPQQGRLSVIIPLVY